MHFNTFLKDPVKKGCFQLPGHPFHSMDHVHSRGSLPQAVPAQPGVSASAEDANGSKDSKLWLAMSETLRFTTAPRAYWAYYLLVI